MTKKARKRQERQARFAALGLPTGQKAVDMLWDIKGQVFEKQMSQTPEELRKDSERIKAWFLQRVNPDNVTFPSDPPKTAAST
jgi:hypothetical protein